MLFRLREQPGAHHHDGSPDDALDREQPACLDEEEHPGIDESCDTLHDRGDRNAPRQHDVHVRRGDDGLRAEPQQVRHTPEEGDQDQEGPAAEAHLDNRPGHVVAVVQRPPHDDRSDAGHEVGDEPRDRVHAGGRLLEVHTVVLDALRHREHDVARDDQGNKEHDVAPSLEAVESTRHDDETSTDDGDGDGQHQAAEPCLAPLHDPGTHLDEREHDDHERLGRRECGRCQNRDECHEQHGVRGLERAAPEGGTPNLSTQDIAEPYLPVGTELPLEPTGHERHLDELEERCDEGEGRHEGENLHDGVVGGARIGRQDLDLQGNGDAAEHGGEHRSEQRQPKELLTLAVRQARQASDLWSRIGRSHGGFPLRDGPRLMHGDENNMRRLDA